MRVLIPIDGGADCREAIRFVTSRKSWIENQKPQIELLYVQKPYIEHPMEEGDFDIQSWYYDDKIKAVFEDMAEDIATLPENVIKTSKIGHPAKVIASYAREIGADLIVMGARGLSALKNLYLGSVSLGTIARPHALFSYAVNITPPKMKILGSASRLTAQALAIFAQNLRSRIRICSAPMLPLKSFMFMRMKRRFHQNFWIRACLNSTNSYPSTNIKSTPTLLSRLWLN